MDKQQIMSMMDCSISDNFTIDNSLSNGTTSSSGTTSTCWDYWQNCYYPYIIRESYPVYISERAIDKGRKAFEIIKILKDKKLVKMEKVSDFIDLMDELIKLL